MKDEMDLFYYKVTNFGKKMKSMIPCKSNRIKRRLIRRNQILKKRFCGDQCFILANGPSICDEDLSLLEGRYIFTVNQMIRKKEFEMLGPMCNFWFDPAYFDEDASKENKAEFERLFKMTCSCNDKIINIVPVSAFQFLQDHGLITKKVYFINDILFYYDGYDREFDLTDLMPGFQNIVQYAIATAVYMGFNEIYLLGCDSTGIITKINSVMAQDIEGCYGYDLGTSGRKYVNSLLDHFSIEEQFMGWTRIFHLYNGLYQYCTKRNIKLMNCSKRTIIESIPRVSLEKVVREN